MDRVGPSSPSPQIYTQRLQQLMGDRGISSFRQLSRICGVSEGQLRQLRQGRVLRMRLETVLKISETLQLPVEGLLERFSPAPVAPQQQPPQESARLEALQQEYRHLQQQLEQQKEILLQQFQQASLQVLESWLVNWSAAAAAVQRNPDLPAARLLPLVEPIERLLEQWQVEAIAAVGETLDYDPQWHQLMEGGAKPGDRVKVRYAGFRHRGKLLFRAKVSPMR